MSHTNAASQTFSARANDIRCRDFSARSSRFARARLRELSGAVLRFADDPRVCTAWRRGWESEHYIRLLRWRDEGFRPRVIYDIGAHEGRWSEMVQAIFSPETIVLFEPQGELQKKAMTRQPAHDAQWLMMPVALGDEARTASLHVTRNAAASSLLKPVEHIDSWGMVPARQETVQVVTLDDCVTSRGVASPDLLKLDVQGYEQSILRGGRETLSHASYLIVEVSLQTLYEGQPLLPDVLHSLVALGFALQDISEGTMSWPGPPAQLDLWLKRDK